MSGSLRSVIAAILAIASIGVVGGLLPATAAADPVLNAVTPNVTAANTGVTITLTGTGFGAADDSVYFDENPALAHAPIAWGMGWLTLRVPPVSSGFLWVKSHGQGPGSNHLPIDITWSYRGAKWPPQRLPFTWFMQRDGAPGCDIQATADALKAAYDTWA